MELGFDMVKPGWETPWDKHDFLESISSSIKADESGLVSDFSFTLLWISRAYKAAITASLLFLLGCSTLFFIPNLLKDKSN